MIDLHTGGQVAGGSDGQTDDSILGVLYAHPIDHADEFSGREKHDKRSIILSSFALEGMARDYFTLNHNMFSFLNNATL